MISATEAVAALGLGLAGSGHCLGMCGGIAAAINLGGSNGAGTTIAYHAGRLISYAVLGALLGALAGSINLAQWTMGLRYLAGFLLIAMGLSIADWWRGISVLERAGAVVWKPVQAFSSRFLPVHHWYQGLFLGTCWGLMPCGLIYSALAWSATAQDATRSATLMLLFGMGTLPAMLATSFSAARAQALLRKRGLKLLIALFLVLSGAWTIYLTTAHGSHLDRTIEANTPDAQATPAAGHAHGHH